MKLVYKGKKRFKKSATGKIIGRHGRGPQDDPIIEKAVKAAEEVAGSKK